MQFRYDVAGATHTVTLETKDAALSVSLDGNDPVELHAVHSGPGILEFELNGKHHRLHVARSGQTRFVADGSDVYELRVAETGTTTRKASDAGAGAGGLLAAMPGQVIAVAVQPGDTVTKGQTLLILEAMKMEYRVQAPYAGSVQQVLVKTGQVVERGQQLVELTAAAE